MTARVVTLTIDGRELSGRDDETILEVARENSIRIPTLCMLEGLSILGGCRLCLVEVKSFAKLMPACATRVTEGMEVTTQSEKLLNYRRMVIEMLFAEGNHICSICVSNGHCELQNQAVRLGIDHIRLPYLYDKRAVDASHPLFGMDENRCILCTRCVRVCDEIEGAHTWDVAKRGIESRVITDFDMPWGASDTCTSCGKCIQVCPTGALFEKGKSAGEMEKRAEFLQYLLAQRGRRS
jgi:bidirectional [NiFe] hydrogenase diaphorase subunit